MRDMKCIRNILISFIILLLEFSIIARGNNIDDEHIKSTFINENKKIIYLTFDDGPSSIVTNNILNILKDQKVKATFFVIGNRIKGSETIIRKIYEEGHSIGLHTYSHKYKQIYASEDAFISEMMKTSVEIHKVIGTLQFQME